MTTEMELEEKLNALSSSESEDEAQVETLVAGRSKRATAGNRMSSMIGEIAADDDLELLFAEDDEAGPDEEFEEEAEDGGSDNDLGESSDDEDQGPTAGVDDLDGEKDIENQAKEDRKRKRKAQRAFTKPSKKIKHAPFVGSAGSAIPASKAKKKIERQSWMPALGEGTRTSRREATTLQSEALRTRIVAREKDRKEQMKRLEEKARRREANKPKALTQEDRLREAAEVEKENSKSLNRWEAIERERQEEQRARLAALQNRQLHGPVISYWSGPARWIGDKLTAVGSEKVKEANLRPETKQSETSDVSKSPGEAEQQSGDTSNPENHRLDETAYNNQGEESLRPSESTSRSLEIPERPKSSGSTSLAPSIREVTTAPSPSPQPSTRPSLREPGRSEEPSVSPQPSTQAPPTSIAPSVSPQPSSRPQDADSAKTSPQPDPSHGGQSRATSNTPMTETQANAQANVEANTGFIKQEPIPSLQQGEGGQQIVFSVATPQRSSTPQSSKHLALPGSRNNLAPSTGQSPQPTGPPPPPPKPVVATRNLISVVNVDISNPTSSTLPRELRGSLLVASSKSAKRSKGSAKSAPPPVCAVTGLPIQYRDPQTGLGYANSYAYRQLKSIQDGRLGWNEVTGTYVGPPPKVPEGVPEAFVTAMKASRV